MATGSRRRRIVMLVAALIAVHAIIAIAVVFEGNGDGASPADSAAPPPAEAAPHCAEAEPIEVPLAGELAKARAEVSGMAWHGDDAILLPQYPERQRPPSAFAIGRATLQRWVQQRGADPISPRSIAFDSGGLEKGVDGYEGYEALAFDGDTVFVLVESNTLDGPRGHVFSGTISAESGIVIDPDSGVELQTQQRIANTAYEALIVLGDRRLALFELNGAENAGAFGVLVPASGGEATAVPWATPLQFRVTDATAADADGRFWVTNVYWPGDGRPRQACPLFDAHGIGETHGRARTVERLVEVQLREGRLRFTDTPPVLLRLAGDDTRNWEGVLRLDAGGFLLVTDEHPRTILAYVRAPDPIAPRPPR